MKKLILTAMEKQRTTTASFKMEKKTPIPPRSGPEETQPGISTPSFDILTCISELRAAFIIHKLSDIDITLEIDSIKDPKELKALETTLRKILNNQSHTHEQHKKINTALASIWLRTT